MATQHHKREQAKSNTCHERNIKVYRAFAQRPKQHPPHLGDPSVPSIQLKGYWLQKAGFKIDSPVKIRVMDGCLVLTTEQKASSL